MAESDTEKSSPSDSSPRKDLINTAVSFLQNPTVQRSTLRHQQAFLKSKGLTDDEIRIACEQSASVTSEKNKIQPSRTLIPIPSEPSHHFATQQQSPWVKFRDFANTVVIIGGISYGLFVIYKKYVVPWVSGKTPKKKTVEQSISELDIALASSVQELRESLNKVHADLKTLHERQQRPSSETPATVKQVEELKAEIASVKGLLLNRSQFAPPVTKSPLTPPSIPAWQLSATESSKEPDEAGQGSKGDADIEDICLSGSGSSETEMVTNNGSDSSLEMIRE